MSYTTEGGIIRPAEDWTPPPEISAADLHLKELPPIRWIVEGILPEGVTMLAAPPKSYKSYMCLAESVCVALGKPFLGRRTNKTNVVYFDLESGERRPKQRLQQIGLGAPDNLFIVPASPKVGILGNGFEKTLMYELVSHDAGLAIIDVFQGIRADMKRTQTGYTKDYADIGQLRAIANETHCAIVLVNHLVKMRQSNIFNQVSGSIGTFGALDALWVIDREDPEAAEATLHITGRDLEPQQLALKWDPFRWEYIGSAEEIAAERARKEYEFNPIRLTILELVKQGGGKWEGQVKDIIAASKYIEKGFLEIFDDERKVGRFISSHKKELKMFDGITSEIKKTNLYNKWIFNSINSTNNTNSTNSTNSINN